MLIQYKIQEEFKSKHEKAIAILSELAKYSIKQAQEILNYACGDDKAELSSEYIDILSPEAAYVLNNYVKSDVKLFKLGYYFTNDPYINVYGHPTFGDLAASKARLLVDLRRGTTYNHEMDEAVFDISKHIAVFLFTGKHLIFDISDTLVRLIDSSKYEEDKDVINLAIASVMVSNICMFVYVINSFKKILMDSEATMANINVGYYTNDPNNQDLYKKENASDMASNMVFLKHVYNVANGLETEEEMLGSLKLFKNLIKERARSIYKFDAVKEAISLSIDKVLGKLDHMPRYIDLVLEEVLNDIGRVNAGAPGVRTNRAYFRDDHIDILDDIDENHGRIASMICESFQSDFDINKELGINAFMGIEAVEPKNIIEFRKKERAKILAKLDSTQRRRYITIENDFMKLKADISNAHDTDTQRILINSANKLGTVIQLEIDRSTSEHLVELLLMLDSERYTLVSELSDKDFFKERNSRLYGQLKTAGKWDF